MATVTVKEAKLRLEELLQGLCPGEDIVVVDQDRPVAHIVSAKTKPLSSATRSLGFLSGSVKRIAEDFDAPLDDMQDHMQ